MYDNPTTITYTWGLVDFGAGGDSVAFQGPPGATGVIRDISASATETFNAVTTEGRVDVGTVADPDAYASLAMGTTADAAAVVAADSDFTDRTLPADTQVEVDFVAPVGGTPAGIAAVFITVDWNLAQPRTPT